jgi:hypothetical protein
MSVDLCWEHNTFNMLVSCCFSKLGVAMAYNVLAKPGRGINTASRPTVWFEDLSLFKIFKFVSIYMDYVLLVYSYSRT